MSGRVRSALLGAGLLLLAGAAEPAGEYQTGGRWRVTVTPVQMPAAAGEQKGTDKTTCRATLTSQSYPKVGREKELVPGVICKIVSITPLGQPYERVDECRRAGQSKAMIVRYSGSYTPKRYSLTITTEMPSRPDLTVVVREDGEWLGPCE